MKVVPAALIGRADRAGSICPLSPGKPPSNTPSFRVFDPARSQS